jgi:hypothetical protein
MRQGVDLSAIRNVIQQLEIGVIYADVHQTTLSLLRKRRDGQRNCRHQHGRENPSPLYDLHVAPRQVPVSVQAPIGVAAAVCGIGANVLAQQVQQGKNSCSAQTTTTAFNKLVAKQVNRR